MRKSPQISIQKPSLFSFHLNLKSNYFKKQNGRFKYYFSRTIDQRHVTNADDALISHPSIIETDTIPGRETKVIQKMKDTASNKLQTS